MMTPDPTARARAIMRDLAEVCRKHECRIVLEDEFDGEVRVFAPGLRMATWDVRPGGGWHAILRDPGGAEKCINEIESTDPEEQAAARWLPGPPPAGFVWSAPHGDVIYCESDGQGGIRPAGTSRDWWEPWREEWRWQPAVAPEPTP